MSEATATPRRKRSSRKGERRRDDILDATLMVIAERGMDGATIGVVAAASAIPKSLVLYHFQSRDGLLHAAICRAVARLESSRESALDVAGSDPREQLRAWIGSIYAEPEILQAWCLLAQSAARTSPGVGLDAIAAFEATSSKAMAELLERGNDELCWQVPSAKNAAVTVLALLDGLRLSVLRASFDADLHKAASATRRAVMDHLVR